MHRLTVVAALALIASACSSDPGQTPTGASAVNLPIQVEARAGTGLNHSVHLNGEQEPFSAAPGAPTPADSHGQGQAIIHIADNELSFDYKLIASNIENIVQAHIHCGPAGVNGPIIIWLYPSVTSQNPAASGAGRHDGVLAEGTVVSGATLNVRNAAASATCPGGVANFADALRQIRAGNAYVNVHTDDGDDTPNTGAGDMVSGEIRGQITPQ